MLYSCACVKSETHKTNGNKASTFSLDICGILSFVIEHERTTQNLKIGWLSVTSHVDLYIVS